MLMLSNMRRLNIHVIAKHMNVSTLGEARVGGDAGGGAIADLLRFVLHPK